MSAALDSKHPNFISRMPDWQIMRHAYAGERAIKSAREDYLAATTAMVMEGMGFGQPGRAAYDAYLSRAVYHELVTPSLTSMLGVMHRKPPDVTLPSRLKGMAERATFGGESLAWLFQKITEQQLLMGRYGLMLDVADGASVNDLPYIVGYNTEQMINWDVTTIKDQRGARQLKFVVLDETGQTRNADLTWEVVQKHRVLARAGDVKSIWPSITAPDDTYVVGYAERALSLLGSEFQVPSFGGRTLEIPPFVFVGPRDLVPDPDMPVLLPLARIALAIYRTEADYRQSLFMQGQDTLVVIGGGTNNSDGRQKVGAFGAIELPKGGDAKLIGAQSSGIAAQSEAIQNDLKRAAQLGAQLLSERGNEAESGEALNIRVASRVATLTTTVQVAAAGLKEILQHAARWVGADPNEVDVKPNLDFVDDPAQAQDLTYLMTGKTMGAPLSRKSIHRWLKKREFTDLTYEEEEEEIANEEPMTPPPAPGVSRGEPGSEPPPPGGTVPRKASTLVKEEAGQI